MYGERPCPMGRERPSSLQMFAGASSLHGVSHIFGSGSLSLRRVVWALFFVGSLALLGLVCAERVGYFFTFPRVTKVDEVAAANLTFPAVTFCNLNAFRFSKITRNDLYHAGQLLALLDARADVRGAHLADPETLAALRDKADFKGFKARPFDMAEFYNRTGHDLREMIWHCTFRGVACSARNFTLTSWWRTTTASAPARRPARQCATARSSLWSRFPARPLPNIWPKSTIGVSNTSCEQPLPCEPWAPCERRRDPALHGLHMHVTLAAVLL